MGLGPEQGLEPRGQGGDREVPKPVTSQHPSPHLPWAPISHGQPGSAEVTLDGYIRLGSARVHQSQALERPSSARMR